MLDDVGIANAFVKCRTILRAFEGIEDPRILVRTTKLRPQGIEECTKK